MKLLIEIPEAYYNVIKAIPDESLGVDRLMIKYGSPQECEGWIKVFPDENGYTKNFKCPRCDGWAEHTSKVSTCYYTYCPHCGSKIIKGEIDGN